MHELSIATALVQEANKVAIEHQARAVSMVRVALGVLSGVESEALSFAFPLVSEGTLLEGARLELEVTPLRLHCSDCEKESEPAEISFVCPFCASSTVTVQGGREILILTMELETDV